MSSQVAPLSVVPSSDGDDVKSWGAGSPPSTSKDEGSNRDAVPKRTNTLVRQDNFVMYADSCKHAGEALTRARPKHSDDDHRTHIKVHLTVKKIRNLDFVRSSVDVRCIIVMEWIAPELKKLIVDCDKLWTPTMDILNADEMNKTSHVPWFFPEEGLVRQVIEFEGTVSNEANFYDFPFETDKIAIIVVSEIDTGDENVHVSYMEGKTVRDICPDFLDRQVTEFKIHQNMVNVRRLTTPDNHGRRLNIYGAFTAIEFSIQVTRHYWYYLWKIMLILTLLCIISWVVFFMDSFNDRMNISVTLLLSAVTFLYVASESIPKLPYLTAIDKMIMMCFFNLFGSTMESFVVHHIVGNEETRKSIDEWAKVLFPTVFFLTTYGIMLLSLRNRKQELKAREVEVGIANDLF